MQRRASHSARLAGALALAALDACGPAQDGEVETRASSPARPSIILVSIDTLRADHLGLYGYERDTTPFLDRFARECLVFERALTPCAWTLIAHMTMLTGLLPAEHGVIQDELALSPEVPLLAERLQDAGYQTVGLYFLGWIHERYGFARGFDVFRPHDDAEGAGQNLAEALSVLDRDKPFFLFLHLFDVHSAELLEENRTVYSAPAPFGELFLSESAAPLPARSAKEMWGSEVRLEPAQIETLVARYDGGIRYVDSKLEGWFADLERDGWLARTLVIVTADHGEALGQRRGKLSGHGGYFQAGLHVPLIVKTHDGRRAGERVLAPVHLADIVPTILDTAGLPHDPLLGGRSLLSAPVEDRVLSGSRRSHTYLVQWPRKLLHLGREGFFAVDLDRDPLEKLPVRIDELEFDRLLSEAHGGRGPYPSPVSIGAASAEELEALRALGYAGETEEESR